MAKVWGTTIVGASGSRASWVVQKSGRARLSPAGDPWNELLMLMMRSGHCS